MLFLIMPTVLFSLDVCVWIETSCSRREDVPSLVRDRCDVVAGCLVLRMERVERLIDFTGSGTDVALAVLLQLDGF